MGPFYALRLRAAAAKAAPGVELGFDTVSRPVGLEDNLRDGVVDIAVDWLPAALDPFVNRKLFSDRLAIVVRRGHPRIGPGAALEALLEEEFVTLHHRVAVERMPEGLQRVIKLGFRETVHVSELLEVPAVVAGSDLLGLFPISMGPMVEERLGLRVLPIPASLPAVPIYMIWHESRRDDSGHRWLRELVAAELGRGGAL
jgi:DNA-binding transcriptional LysR family regulator